MPFAARRLRVPFSILDCIDQPTIWRLNKSIHLGGQSSWVYSLGLLPLAMVFAIEFTMPIWTALLAVLFWMSAIQTPICLAVAWADWAAPRPQDWPWIAGIGVGSFTAHYCLTRAMRIADASVVVPVDFFRPPLIAVVGALFYAEAFDPAVILGAALIFAGVYFSISRERTHAVRPSP